MISLETGELSRLDTSTGIMSPVATLGKKSDDLAYDLGGDRWVYLDAIEQRFAWVSAETGMSGFFGIHNGLAKEFNGRELIGGGFRDGTYYLARRGESQQADQLVWLDMAARPGLSEAAGTIAVRAGEGWLGSAPGRVLDLTVELGVPVLWGISRDASCRVKLWTWPLAKAGAKLRVIRDFGSINERTQLSFDSDGSLWISSASGNRLRQLSVKDGAITKELSLGNSFHIWDLAPSPSNAPSPTPLAARGVDTPGESPQNLRP